ncbi:MAG TPA: hypothetical protein VFT95_10720, partial [Micromonosporaceae bacterium]|nr:hypothetical protein [Micromonosporaceae bacterium]
DQLTFWARLERRVLAPLRAGRPARYRAYDWERGGFGGAEHEVGPAPVVIVEGMSAARAAARALASFTVFVTAPPELRLARSLARDGAAMQAYLNQWRRREDRHFAADATAANVDLVVLGAPGGDRDGGREGAGTWTSAPTLGHQTSIPAREAGRRR